MDRLENVVQRYAWGSHTALAQLQGRPPSGEPEAELWLGAHPNAPSLLAASGTPLDQAVRQAPAELLGEQVAAQFGHLPFLLKVLAAAQPLSLQAHPSRAQAKAGFAREEAQGLARTAPDRNYKDDHHKPELICALTPFDALCGFRAPAQTLALFEVLGVTPLLEALRARDVRRAFEQLMNLPRPWQTALATQVVAACAERPAPAFERECAWAVRLGARYPGDPGVVGALMLNLVRLEPGQALYLPAGNLHAYLEGVGVELMASSDNVLRGGLTPKHVDVPELLSVLDFGAGPVTVLTPRGAPEAVYETPAPEFRLSRCQVRAPLTLERRGPDILLCTEGKVTVRAGTSLALEQGASAFVAWADGPIHLDGAGVVFRATVGA